jgi:hypothetical protein
MFNTVHNYEAETAASSVAAKQITSKITIEPMLSLLTLNK